MRDEKLLPEDYTDPQCPFCTDQFAKEPPVRRIPGDRVIERLDEYLAKEDYAGAERHLRYWLEEARAGRDGRGEFLIRNEMMGFYRKCGEEEKALESMNAALSLLAPLGMEESTGAGTAYVNAGTVLKSFGKAPEALPFFEKARAIYEKELPAGDPRLGGLYNNLGLALTDCGRYAEAREYYEKALSAMADHPLEQAITRLNLANNREAEFGAEAAEEAIGADLDRAEELLSAPEIPQNGYYAFVCESCAPTFGYYGRFFTEAELEEKARRIRAEWKDES